MRRRAPWTLWIYVFAELWRLLLLSSAVLVTVIAFAACIPPLADGKLQPTDALKFVLLAIPPMLAYALPFAGCFAATLVYHRLASDLEVTAAAAGGVSHRSFLAPALVTGLLLCGGLAALNEQVIPRFLRSMQQLITFDVAKILTSSINRGQAVDLGGTLLYADRAQLVEPQRGSGEYARLVLARPALLRLNGEGQVEGEGTAARALVALLPGPVRTEGGISAGPTTRVRIQLENFTGRDRERGVRGQSLPALWLDVPSAFQDDPKFLTAGELRGLRQRPEGMNWIDARRRAVAVELARERTVAELDRELQTVRRAVFTDGAGRQVVLRAGGIAADGAGWKLLPPASGVPVEVERSDNGGVTRFSAAEARLAPDNTASANVQSGGFFPVEEEQASADAAPTALRLELKNSIARNPRGEAGSTRAVTTLSGLHTSGDRLDEFTARGAFELLGEAGVAGNTSANVNPGPAATAARALAADIADLQREVTSKQHERAALAAACAVMVLTGAVMALRFSRSLPLTVYLCAFFPALWAVVTISGGQQMIHAQGSIGLPVLWGGVGVLSLLTLVVYAQVRRH